MEWNPSFFPLFQGLSQPEFDRLRAVCRLRSKSYERGRAIFPQGEPIGELGLVLTGAVRIESVDSWGNRSVFSQAGPGEAFGEAYALTGRPLLVSAVAAQPSQILLLETAPLFQGEEPWRLKVAQGLLRLFAGKNLALSQRMFCTAPKSVRGRVLAYLSGQAVERGGRSFSIPFDRQQLADYLEVDRSALSKELGKMRDEGLLLFRKNRFTLLEMPEEG